MKARFPLQFFRLLTILSLVLVMAPAARAQDVQDVQAAAGSPTNGLLLWNKLGTQSEVTQSAIGLPGTFKGGSFTTGMFGGAYLARHDQNRLVTFPKEVVPVSAGTIELWAKFIDFPNELAWGENPNLFRIIDANSHFSIHLNGNDGVGDGGLCARAGAGYSACTGGYGYWTYQSALGGGDPTQWHHYALIWDKKGISGVGDGNRKLAVFLDGKLNSANWYDGGIQDFVPLVSGELGLMDDQNLNQGSLALDNIKIWNYAKTDFSDRFVEGETPQSLCTSKYQGSMVGYWRFDNASDPMQATVGSLRGAVVGNSKTSAGIAGKALEFDGQSYVDYGTAMDIPSWNQYTVSIWFKNDNRIAPYTGYGQKIIDKTTWYSDFYLSLYTNVSPPILQYKTYTTGWNFINSNSTNYIGSWHHAVMVRNGGHAELWVDGQLKSTSESFETVINNQPLLLGYSLSGDGYQRQYWGGYLDEFAVFNRALTAGEIGELYANSAAGRSYCTSAPAAMTIVKQARPFSTRNFRFYGPFGEFRLDNPEVDDQDGVADRMRYEVVAGNYGFSEMQVTGWQATDILCSKPERAAVNLAQQTLALHLQAGDDVTCTFVNQQSVTAYARAYWDKNANRIYDVGELWKSGIWTEIYDSAGKRLVAKFTDTAGQVGAFNLLPGTYSLCQTPPSGWWNTQPGKLDPRFNKPCYTFTINSGGVVTGYFGWLDRALAYAADDESAAVDGLEITPFIDREQGAEDENVAGNNHLYLPVITR